MTTQTSLNFQELEAQPEPAKLPSRGTGEASRYLQFKLVEHAKRMGVRLQGSADGGTRGFPSYCPSIEANLYPGSLDGRTIREYQKASGQELRTNKMACAWSSSALVVSTWSPFRDRPGDILRALRLPAAGADTMVCEWQAPIFNFGSPPNLDVAIFYRDRSVLAVESKLGEVWGVGRSKLGQRAKNKYRTLHALWQEWPHLGRFFCEQPCPHEFLDSHQLTKHLIGCRLSGRPWQLLYLFWDAAGRESSYHWEEIDHFRSILQQDGLDKFFAVRTYQQLFQGLVKYQPGPHTDWLLSRYG